MTDEQKNDEPYRVLARKYRPQSFAELIGQDALVRTLTNAIESGRIAHAFMLTGVRGVGKTTTARIIAKALNYTGADGSAGPSTGDTSDCQLCQAISEDRHPDVIEMDAASRTGVDDIREILDGVRYAPTEARYKVYVIDEVHMLSKNAFNALLKTLEEPPEHVKFIFATTEIRKVPITVLSRCQRFDLRRVDVPTLSAHFGRICEKEGVKADDEAIALIARAADGSVRDGLSLLDQAMALASAEITADDVAGMLGLSDRARGLDLLEHVLRGNMPEALEILDELYANGADPLQLMQDLLDLVHILTKMRAIPAAKDMKYAMAADQVARAADIAAGLSMPTLAKAWQILLKGLAEVQSAPNSQSAAEMVIIRLSYAADLPDPKDLLKMVQDGGGSDAVSSAAMAGGASSQGAAAGGGIASSSAPVRHHSTSEPSAAVSAPVSMGAGHAASERPSGRYVSEGSPRAALSIVPDVAPDVATEAQFSHQIQSLEDVVRVLEDADEMLLASNVHHYVHLVKLDAKTDGGRLEIRPAPEAPPKLAPDLGSALTRLTGKRWVVSISSASGQLSLAEKSAQAVQAQRDEILALPIMRDIMAVFPDAEMVGIENLEQE